MSILVISLCGEIKCCITILTWLCSIHGNSDRAMEGDLIIPWDACHTTRDLSHERELRDTALAKQVVETIAREMAKAHAYYQALLNERGTAAMPTILKMTSGALGFKVMDPFD